MPSGTRSEITSCLVWGQLLAACEWLHVILKASFPVSISLPNWTGTFPGICIVWFPSRAFEWDEVFVLRYFKLVGGKQV